MNYLIIPFLIVSSCLPYSNDIPTDPLKKKKFEAYWYNNEAEISSYTLSQARYGELHQGTAVLIFVTEHHSPSSGTKPDNVGKNDIPILKLNFTKKFNTGIYPYSMMTSTFLPVSNGEHSLKISSSSQEWCGHTYMEMFNRKQFDIQISSYFEGESKKFKVKKNLLEDDLWTMIRLNPGDLPIGKLNVIPSFFALRLLHKPFKAYLCELSLTSNDDNQTYHIKYPELERSVKINFEKEFPYRILSWEETSSSGFGDNRRKLTSVQSSA